MIRITKILTKLFRPTEPLPLGRWTLKTPEKQLTSPVADPGYNYIIHWSKVPAGSLRRQAIKNHLDNVHK